MTHLLTAETIVDGWTPRRVGRDVVVLGETGSTNSFVLERAAEDAPASLDGLVVFAERQTAGRGRMGRAWHCPTGAGLMFSVLLLEPDGRVAPSAWMMLAGVAVAEGVAAATDVEPRLRWPNDLYGAGRKLGGILVEIRTLDHGARGVAIGVGINCLQQPLHFPESVRERAASLDMLSKMPIDRTRIARAVLQNLDACLDASLHHDEARLSDLWRDRSADIGNHITVQSGQDTFAGYVLDVHPREGLLLQLEHGGRRHFDAARTTRSDGLIPSP